MQYIELRRQLKGFTVFSLSDVRNLDPSFYRRRLSEWQDKGYIKKLLKGYYIFSDLTLNENVLFEIANRVYNPSYISFESALSYHGLIPESVYGITSASSRRTYRFKTPIAEFYYRTVNPRLFFGYEIVKQGNKSFKMANPEKALLDYFYINTEIRKKEDFLSLRINKDNLLNRLDETRMKRYIKRFAQRVLTKRVNTFLEVINNA